MKLLFHFLKRDFLDFRLYWAIVGGFTLLYVFTYHSTRGSWFGRQSLLIAYVILALFAQPHVLGSLWRTQHKLSRYYLLALPIQHKRLFALQQLRILVFWLPLLCLGGVFPMLSGAFSSIPWGTWLLYYLGLITTAGLFIEYGIWSTVEWEQMVRYLPQGARFGAYIKLLGIPMAVLFFLLQPAWITLILPILLASESPELAHKLTNNHIVFGFLSPPIVFAIAAIVLILWIPRIARKWCVTI